MKKSRVVIMTFALVGALALGAAATVTVQEITASLRPDISVTVDGKNQDLISQDGGTVYAISYNGTTYLPVRALSEALGKDVVWDQRTQTVTLTTPAAQKPTEGTQTPGATDIKSYEARISALTVRVDAMEKAPVWALTAFRTLEQDIDTLEDELERTYKDGKLTKAQYRALDDKLDILDNRLDDLDDRWENDD